MCLSVLILIKKIMFPCRLVKQVLNVNVNHRQSLDRDLRYAGSCASGQ